MVSRHATLVFLLAVLFLASGLPVAVAKDVSTAAGGDLITGQCLIQMKQQMSKLEQATEEPEIPGEWLVLKEKQTSQSSTAHGGVSSRAVDGDTGNKSQPMPQPTPAQTTAPVAEDQQMVDIFKFWNTYRDPRNGLYCDFMSFQNTVVCGPSNNFYSLASVGMGLVADCIFAELGLLSKAAAEARSLQTIKTVVKSWPRCQSTGFFQHFTNQRFSALAEYSTIDTAIGTLGALFAGKYFGGEVAQNAQAFATTAKWTKAIPGTEPPAEEGSGHLPSVCRRHVQWGFKHGKKMGWYKRSFAKKMYLVSGVSLKEATVQDFQRMYKCQGMNAKDCKDLDFPQTCSKPPCNACLGPSMYTIAKNGKMKGSFLKPFNEYYLVAYLASMASLASPGTTAVNLQLARRYFEVFYGSTSEPPGDGDYPVHKQYHGIKLLSDNGGAYIPHFHVQFNYFLAAAFGGSHFYRKLFSDSMRADKKYWDQKLTSSSSVRGKLIKGKVWGLGAGWTPARYQANSITHNRDLVFSAPIMAGFLKADLSDTDNIVSQLRYMYKNDICALSKRLPSGEHAKVLWRCSVKKPRWKATRAESIDFSTMVLGFAQQYLPNDFYQRYAA